MRKTYPLFQATFLARWLLAVRCVCADGCRFLQCWLTIQRGVSHVLINGVNSHLRDVLSCFGLDVKRDQAICDQVVDWLEPFLSHKVLAIVIEAEVAGLVPEADWGRWKRKGGKKNKCWWKNQYERKRANDQVKNERIMAMRKWCLAERTLTARNMTS